MDWTHEKIGLGAISLNPAIAVQGEHIAVVENHGGTQVKTRDLWFTESNDDGKTWISAIYIAIPEGDALGTTPEEIIFTNDGSIHVFWSESGVAHRNLYYNKRVNNVWEGAKRIIEDNINGVSITTDGTVIHVAYVKVITSGIQSNPYYMSSSDDFTNKVELSSSNGYTSLTRIELYKGNPVIIYDRGIHSGEFGIYSKELNKEELTISEPRCYWPWAAATEDKLGVVYQKNEATVNAYVSEYTGTSWSTPILLPNDGKECTYPIITYDDTGNKHIFWCNKLGGELDLVYTTNSSGNFAAPTRINGSRTNGHRVVYRNGKLYLVCHYDNGTGWVTEFLTLQIGLPFVDITGNTFITAIEELVELGAIEGTDATHFGPQFPANRGEYAKAIVIVLKIPLANPETPTFTDIDKDNPLYQIIEGGVAAGILNGYKNPDNTKSFAAELYITRDQAAVLIQHAKQWPNGGAHFSDVDSTYWAFAAIGALFEHNIIKGYSDGTYKPHNQIRRDELCSIISKTINTI